MTLSEFLYKLAGELDCDPEDSNAQVVFRYRGIAFKPAQSTPTLDRGILFVNIEDAGDLHNAE